MTDGAKCGRNRRIRAELYQEIEAMAPGTVITTATLVKKYSTGSRHVNSHCMGSLLRELDTVERVSCGVWRRVAV